ncbi:uncharacterized protein LOC115740329 [Rhodamnia argentea]|uniref:Uncharacterized protein LOC115740329 n=1 Tax=Rhodamnia argentea TaxID=178133 RepID=A0A8B8P498_9MYRT|nr:uncharacterized protein LOC115740329 [Rhodamnia argentea]
MDTPELQKADPIPALVETTEAFSPAPIEVSSISGGSQPFHVDQGAHLTPQEQLQLPVQSNLSPDQLLLHPASGMQSQLPPSNLPVDQPVRSLFGFHGAGVNVHNMTNYITLPTPNLPPEIHLPSSARFPGSQLNPSYSQVSSQVGNGIATRTQWANSHPQQQINMFEPSIPSRQQDIQGQRLLGLLPHVSLPPTNSIYQSGGSPYLQLPSNPTQLGMGAYNMGPLLPLHMEELPAIGDFNNGLGLGVQGPFLTGSQIGMGESSPRQPLRPPLVNMTWSDIIHPTPAPELTNRVPQVQGTPRQVPNNRPIFNSVYDPMYEAMGLPIDPHLRMFLASKRERDSGK